MKEVLAGLKKSPSFEDSSEGVIMSAVDQVDQNEDSVASFKRVRVLCKTRLRQSLHEDDGYLVWRNDQDRWIPRARRGTSRGPNFTLADFGFQLAEGWSWGGTFYPRLG